MARTTATLTDRRQLKNTTSTDPAENAAVTTAIVDSFSAVTIVTTEAANAQVLQSPTSTTKRVRFTVINSSTSSDPVTVNGTVLAVGNTRYFIWDGSAWGEDAGVIGDNIVTEGSLTVGSTNQHRLSVSPGVTQKRKVILNQSVDNDFQFFGFGLMPPADAGLKYQVTATTNSHQFFAATSDSAEDELMRISGTGKVGIGGTPSANENDLLLNKDGVLAMKETTTPTADANFGKFYFKADNKAYVQTGDGVEHEIAFV